jgi:hypothetical protein
LCLTSLPILGLSAMCMSEIPGLLMTFVTFLLYLKALNSQKSYLFVLASISMALTLFTKWHHGVFVIPAIFLTQITYNHKILSRSNYCLFVPFFVLCAAWFAHPQHILSFYNHSTFQPHFYTLFSLSNLLYYPKSFIQVYHFSPLVGIVMGISFLYSLKNITNKTVLLFATQIFVGLILLTIKLDNRHRYIITIVPSMWLLGTAQLAEAVRYCGQRLHSKPIKISLASTAITAFLVVSFFSVPTVYRTYPDALLTTQYWCDEKPNKAYQFIANALPNHNHIAVFGSWDYYNRLNSPAIRWNIEVRRQNDVMEKTDKKKKAYDYFCQLLRNRDSVSYHNFIHFLENKDLKVHEYHLLSFMKMLNEKAYRDYRTRITLNPFSDKIVDVNSIDASVGYLITICYEKEPELNRYTEDFLAKQHQWIEFKRETFADLGIEIAIYERSAV